MSHYPHPNSRPNNKPLKRSATFATPSTSMGRTHSTSSYWQTVIDHTTTSTTSNHYPSVSPHHPSATSSSSSSRPRPISKPYPRDCPTCKRTFPSARIYDEHKIACAPPSEKPYECHECGTAFKKNSNLVKHMKLVHRGEKNFACHEPGCGRMFGQKSNLNSHIKAVHLGEKPFVCPEASCGRRFSQKSGLKAHVKTVHNGERPYVCECGSSFGHRGDLNRHIRVLHEKQRPFECPHCPEPKRFGRKSVLMRHMLTHSNGQPGHGPMSYTMSDGSSSTR